MELRQRGRRSRYVFFQAEDGIRDIGVTGVQTCALPISPVSVESPLKYHSGRIGCLTSVRDPDQEQCQVGSLTGAVASQNATEAPKGYLSLVGNQVSSARAQGSLTVRPTGRAGAKAGTSEPAPACGSGVAQRIKGTPGITG